MPPPYFALARTGAGGKRVRGCGTTLRAAENASRTAPPAPPGGRDGGGRQFVGARDARVPADRQTALPRCAHNITLANIAGGGAEEPQANMAGDARDLLTLTLYYLPTGVLRILTCS